VDILRNGIILNTEKYAECVSFYKDIFDLNIMFQKNDGDFSLTCFEFGGAYLMIETGGVAKGEGKSVAENSTKLRFNVADIDTAFEGLKSCGVEADIEKNDWGSTINIYDPDGNRIGIRDESTFKAQIKT
jgi:lactoylglutathione lyase